MAEWLALTEHNWVLWLAGLFALLNFGKWLYEIGVIICEYLFTKKGIETKKMREKREWEDRLIKAEKDIEEIKNTSKYNVNMFLDHEKQVVDKFMDIKSEIVTEIGKLHEEMEKTNETNKKTDCAMLRDRIASGMRYFGQNKDEEGRVHIAFSDYVNLDELFQRYFAHDGNGTFGRMYEEVFKHFIIDD